MHEEVTEQLNVVRCMYSSFIIKLLNFIIINIYIYITYNIYIYITYITYIYTYIIIKWFSISIFFLLI